MWSSDKNQPLTNEILQSDTVCSQCAINIKAQELEITRLEAALKDQNQQEKLQKKQRRLEVSSLQEQSSSSKKWTKKQQQSDLGRVSSSQLMLGRVVQLTQTALRWIWLDGDERRRRSKTASTMHLYKHSSFIIHHSPLDLEKTLCKGEKNERLGPRGLQALLAAAAHRVAPQHRLPDAHVRGHDAAVALQALRAPLQCDLEGVSLPCVRTLGLPRVLEMYVIRFIRACVECLSIVNKWSDLELLTEFAVSPWVVESSKCRLALHLADALRTKPEQRLVVLGMLKHFGRTAVDTDNAMLTELAEDDWVATNTEEEVCSLGNHSQTDSFEAKKTGKREYAQFLVQQCFEVSVPELPIQECLFAESDGSRLYPIYFDDETEAPTAPAMENEADYEECIQNYDLLGRDLNTDDMRLICELASKELDATKAFISIVKGKQQHSVAVQPGFECGLLERSQTFCAFALTSPRPFLVRDATLDIRFRNFEDVRGSVHTQFYFGFPIASATGMVVASLCIIDTKPRKHITTMQYSIIKKLAQMISAIRTEKLHHA